MAGTTSRSALPYPSPTDSNNVPLDLQRLATAIDAGSVAFLQGALSALPAAATPGRLYAATDQNPVGVYYDTGTAWLFINGSLASAFTTKGDVVAATAAGTPARVAVGTDGQSLNARASYAAGVGWEPVLGLPLGLPGATAAARFAGGTVTGAPVTGTFAVGDLVTSQDGNQWVCTIAGTPGTFIQIGAGTTQVVQASAVAPQTGFTQTNGNTSGYFSTQSPTPQVTITNPSTTRSMLVEAALNSFSTCVIYNSAPAKYEMVTNVDLQQNGVSLDPGIEEQTQDVTLSLFRRRSSTYYTTLPPSGSVMYQGNLTAGVIGASGQTYQLTVKGFLYVQGWTI